MSKTGPCIAATEGRGEKGEAIFTFISKTRVLPSIVYHSPYCICVVMKIKQFTHYFDSSAIPVVYQRTCTQMYLFLH